jgi:hypothetical protein
VPFQKPCAIEGINITLITNDFNLIDFSCFYWPNNTQTVLIKSGSNIELQLLGSMGFTNLFLRFPLLLPRNPNHQSPAYLLVEST